MRLALTLIPCVMVLCGWTSCGQFRPAEPPKVVRVTVKETVEVPPDMTRLCLEYAPREQSYDEAKRLALLRLDSVKVCNCKLIRIAGLKRPFSPVEEKLLAECAKIEPEKK